MQGDKLASGARTASFAVAPDLKVDKVQMQKDLSLLPQAAFCDKYMITSREYELLNDAKDAVEVIDKFANARELMDRAIAADDAQEASLRRDCFIEPFVAVDIIGRVLVTRDSPPKLKDGSRIIAPPRSKRNRELLPTTGHIIKAKVYRTDGVDVSPEFIGRRIVFGQMSGTAICFRNYPTWIQLEVTEILAVVHKEDAEVEEADLEPMV